MGLLLWNSEGRFPIQAGLRSYWNWHAVLNWPSSWSWIGPTLVPQWVRRWFRFVLPVIWLYLNDRLNYIRIVEDGHGWPQTYFWLSVDDSRPRDSGFDHGES